MFTAFTSDNRSCNISWYYAGHHTRHEICYDLLYFLFCFYVTRNKLEFISSLTLRTNFIFHHQSYTHYVLASRHHIFSFSFLCFYIISLLFSFFFFLFDKFSNVCLFFFFNFLGKYSFS